MKIAYIVLRRMMPFGDGICNYTEELGSRLAERGHDVLVYTMRHYGTKDGIYKRMRIKTIPTIRSRSLEKLIATFMAALYQCAERKIDIVHFHAFGPAMFSIIPRLIGRKVVVQGHGLEWKRAKWGRFGKLFLKITEFLSVKFPHTVTVVSEVQKIYLKEKYNIDSYCIKTGVNLAQLLTPELIKKYGLNGNDYILFVGRMVREKGAHTLIEAYKRLKTNLKLVIAGDAAYEDAYKDELHRLAKDNKNIMLIGFVSGEILQELFSNCYLFVLSSEVEGLSTTLIESMSYGNCCLVSDIPENLEALNNYGYSFRNKDVNDLVEKLDYLINNQNVVELVKEEAKAYVYKNHLWDKIAEDFESLYIKMLRN